MIQITYKDVYKRQTQHNVNHSGQVIIGVTSLLREMRKIYFMLGYLSQGFIVLRYDLGCMMFSPKKNHAFFPAYYHSPMTKTC